MDEHNNYSMEFINATRELKKLFPQLPYLRRRFQHVFLIPRQQSRSAKRCIRYFFTTPRKPAWIWASSMPVSSRSTTTSIPELRELVEDVVLNRRDDATERLLEAADKYKGEGKKQEKDEAWREKPVAERLKYSLVKGIDKYGGSSKIPRRLARRMPVRSRSLRAR